MYQTKCFKCSTNLWLYYLVKYYYQLLDAKICNVVQRCVVGSLTIAVACKLSAESVGDLLS